MTRISSSMIAATLVFGLVAVAQAATPLGSNFDGRMSLIYNNPDGRVFIENAPHPNPHVQRLQIASTSGLLEPSDLSMSLPLGMVINSNTPTLLDIMWPSGPALGTGSLLGDILPDSQAVGLLQGDLTIMYSSSGLTLNNEGDLIHTSIPGSTQGNPVLPNGPGPFFRFFDVASGKFFDPPMATGYEYSMDSAGLFTAVGFPYGYGNNFKIVSSEGVVSGLGEGDYHTFSGGVSSFKVLGINPAVDATDPEAFPIFLEFSAPTGNYFSMQAIPEPSTLALVGLAMLGACGRFTRRR